MLTVITPWRDAPELIDDYKAVMARADRIVIVLNQTTDVVTIEKLGAWSISDVRVKIVHAQTPAGFSALNNIGALNMHHMTDVVYFVNNDVYGDPDWVDHAYRIAKATDALSGAEFSMQPIGAHTISFLSGWCIGASVRVWDRLNWWRVLPAPYYWEDAELCLRATRMGIPLNVQTSAWSIKHKGNATIRHHRGMFHLAGVNEEFLLNMIESERNT